MQMTNIIINLFAPKHNQIIMDSRAPLWFNGSMNLNKPLCILAFVGIVLYLAINMIATGSEPGDPEASAAEADTPLLSKAEMAEAAVKYVQEQTQAPLSSPQTFVTFETHKSFSGYLQQRRLDDDYESQFGDRYPIDYFKVDVRDPSTRTHYTIDLNMKNGDVTGWSRLGAPSRAHAGMSDVAALYLQKHGYDLRQFQLDSPDNRLAGRVVFSDVKPAVGESRLQFFVDVADGEVVGFHTAFSVPNSFTSWFKKQNKTASLLTSINLYGTVLLGLLAIVLVIIRARQIRFAQGALIALVFLVVYTINNMNAYPAVRAGQADDAGNISFTAYIVFIQIVTVSLAVLLYFNLLSGERMWRSRGLPAWPRWRDADFGRSVWHAMGRGYLLCLFLVGLQQLIFFIAETKFHVWAVNDAADSPYNMYNPYIFPTMAWAAAISEEGAYRLFGIALFLKLVRFRFLAVLLPSILWALGHTEYAIYPVYTRLIEVTLLGLVFGYAFLKYGFLTALFAHASMDSVLMGLSMWSISTWPGLFLGFIYIVSPFVVAWVIYRLHSRRQLRRQRPPLPPHLPEAP
jgi:hypothetical protein